jgi:hypothetical protein
MRTNVSPIYPNLKLDTGNGVITCMYVCMYVCMHVRGVGHIQPLHHDPSLFYCALPLINPLLIPHFKRNVQFFL